MHFWERLSKRNHVSKGSRNLSSPTPKEHLPVVSTSPESPSFREVQKLFPGFQVQSNLTQKWLRGNPFGFRFIPARAPSGFQLDFKLDPKWMSTGLRLESECSSGAQWDSTCYPTGVQLESRPNWNRGGVRPTLNLIKNC